MDLTSLINLVSTNASPTLEEIQVTGSIAVTNFVSLSGTFCFTETTAPDADNMGTTTMILIGASDVNAFIGADGYGVQISAGTLGLVIYRDSEASGSTYALDASGSIAVEGLPNEVTLTGTANVMINTTGKAVDVTNIPGTSQTVSFATTDNVESFGGSLNLTISPASGSSFTLMGDFSFTEEVDGNISKVLVGATNISTPSTITADAGGGLQPERWHPGNGVLHEHDDEHVPGLCTHRLGDGHRGGGKLISQRHADNSAQYHHRCRFPRRFERHRDRRGHHDSGGLHRAQEGTTAAAFQTIVISNASLSIDNSFILTEKSGTSSTPVAGASSTILTGVTLTLQDPSNSDVLFTISAGSGVYTTFSSAVSATSLAATSSASGVSAGSGVVVTPAVMEPYIVDGATLVINEGLSDQETVTVSAVTTNTFTATFAQAHAANFTIGDVLNPLSGGGSWAPGDIDLVLDNASFTIGSYVSFTAASIDLQHSVVSGVTTDSFIFNTATLALLNNGQPLVSLTGNMTFNYTTGGSSSNNGFMMVSASITGFSFLDPMETLGPITLSTPTVSLSGFSFDLSGTLMATVSINDAMASITTGPISATFTNLDGSVSLGLQFNLADLTQPPTILSPAGFSITADNLTVQLGQYVTLSAGTMANPLTIDPTAGANQNLVSFGTLSATLLIPGTSVQITGSASNFAIEGNGTFLAEPGFSVGFMLCANSTSDSSSLGWPSWLPLTSASVSLVWPNFTADPSDFMIDLSASISTTIGGATLSGSVTNVVIDPSLVAAGEFPVTSIGGLSVGVSGNLFGGTVSGTLIAGVVQIDSKGQVVNGPDNYTPYTSAFYAGIEGGISIAGLAGFDIRVGLSQFGPLQVYVEADVPIPIGETGLFLSDFRGGITFNTSFPDILSAQPQVSDALKLGGPAFSTPDSLTAAQWQSQLEQQVANQVDSGQTGGFTFPSGPFIIQAGLTLYDVNPDVFNVTGDVFFDTTGNFLVIGTATVGDGFSVGAKVYMNLGNPSPTILFLIQSPAQPNPTNTPAIYQAYGFVTFADMNNVFQITIAGEADFNVLNALKAEVTATLTLTFTSNSFNITVSNGTLTIPEIQSTPLGTADGSLTIENANGTVEIWGGLLLTTNLTALNAEGIYTSAQVNVELNTTDEVQTITLTNGTLTLDPESFSLFINGVADFQIGGEVIFELDGSLSLQISATSLSIFVQAQLLLGPDQNNPILTFNASGLIYVQLVADDSDPSNPILPGFAAKLALTMGAGVPSGITFGENWLLVMNTTLGTVTYTIPSPVPTNPPSPPVPTVLGPDYSSGNPLALTSYETDTASVVSGGTGYQVGDVLTVSGGTFTAATTLMVSSIGAGGAVTGVTVTAGGVYTVQPTNPVGVGGGNGSGATFSITRTLVIPNGPPAGELTDYTDWMPPPDLANTAYFIVLGRGSLTVGNVFTLTGETNIDADVSTAGVSFTLETNAAMALSIDGNTIFSFTTAGGIQISNAGVAAALVMQRSGGVPGGLGFNLSATYLLELNTTSATVTLAGVSLPANQAMVQATGDLTLLGNVVDLNGVFDITVNSTSLTVGVTANVTFLGATFTADGYAGIYYDSHPGLALNIDLSLPGGAQGIAPISALGNNFVISGAFDLQLNTCSVARMDAAPGKTDMIQPGAEVSVSNLGVYLYGFNLTGSISIGITDAGFSFTTSLNLDLFGFANIAITGYYYGPTDFDFDGTAGFQFGDHTFGIGGTISVDVSSNGFAASVSGWAAAFGLQISADGSIAITGSSVDISVGFSVTIIPAVHINFDWVHINTNAVVVTENATFHLGSVSPPPVVAPANPPPAPPPAPPPLAGFVPSNGNTLELYIGQDAGNRIYGNNMVIEAQNENYSLTRVAGDPNSNNGETIQVSALGQTQTFDNVQEILVNNTQQYDDIIAIDNSVAVPVDMTLGSGNNTISAGSGPATIAVVHGNNQITSGADSNITISGGGNNGVTSGADSTITISGGGNNGVTSGAGSTITISAAGNNVVSTGANSDVNVQAGGTGSNQITAGNGSTISIAAAGSGKNQVAVGGAATVTIAGTENNTVSDSDNGGTDATSIMITGTGANTVNVNDGTPTITVASTATGDNSVNVNTASFSTISVNGGGDNSISTIGGGAATITVDGNGNNLISTGGTAGGPATNVYLVGSGSNEVSTGAGPANVYDQGTGGNIVSGGSGGGTDYYGVDGSGAAYTSKGSSYLTTAYDNFDASVMGYSTYVLASYGLAVGDFVTNQPVTTSASAIAAGTVVVTPAVMEPYIAPGADLVINKGQPDQEFVTVSAVTGSTFTATFGQPHSPNFTIGDIDNVYTLGLSGVPSVTMNAASAVNSFTLEGWTGNATLNGHGTTNTMYSSPAAGVGGLSYVLSNSSLQITGSVTQTITFNDIQTADLTGSTSGANSFDVSSWTGNGALTGQDNNNTLIATDNVANFTLSDTLFQRGLRQHRSVGHSVCRPHRG